VNERDLLYHLQQGCKVDYKRRRPAVSDSDGEGPPPPAAAAGAAPDARGLDTGTGGTPLQPATHTSGLVSGLPAVNAEVGSPALQQGMHRETQQLHMQQQEHQTHNSLQHNHVILAHLMLQSNDEPLEQGVPAVGTPGDSADSEDSTGTDLDVRRARAALKTMDRVA